MKQTPPLLRLPVECRQRIYECLFEEPSSQDLTSQGPNSCVHTQSSSRTIRAVNRQLCAEFDGFFPRSLSPAIARSLHACSRNRDIAGIHNEEGFARLAYGPMPQSQLPTLLSIIQNVGPRLDQPMTMTVPPSFPQVGCASFRRNRRSHAPMGGASLSPREAEFYFRQRCQLLLTTLRELTRVSLFHCIVDPSRAVDDEIQRTLLRSLEDKRLTTYSLKVEFAAPFSSQAASLHMLHASHLNAALPLFDGHSLRFLSRLDLSEAVLTPKSIHSLEGALRHCSALTDLRVGFDASQNETESPPSSSSERSELWSQIKRLCVTLGPSLMSQWDAPHSDFNALFSLIGSCTNLEHLSLITSESSAGRTQLGRAPREKLISALLPLSRLGELVLGDSFHLQDDLLSLQPLLDRPHQGSFKVALHGTGWRPDQLKRLLPTEQPRARPHVFLTLIGPMVSQKPSPPGVEPFAISSSLMFSRETTSPPDVWTPMCRRWLQTNALGVLALTMADWQGMPRDRDDPPHPLTKLQQSYEGRLWLGNEAKQNQPTW